ncbi:MAG: tetratricopeptide repeat protein, partial [Thermoguttaceae bacterium]|nr:tetratricopeptide repeat protein [Thermoguttaceae bacterium]
KAGNGEGLPADAILAQLYAERGDLAAAKASLADALKLNPKSPAVLALSITTALEENDLDGAWNLAQKLYAEDKSPDVLKVYGNVCLFRADYAGAEAAFQEAVRQNSLDADAIGGLALALCEQDDADKRARAIQYAASNLQRQANNRDCLGILGWAQYKSGDLDAALNTLQQSVADGRLNAATAYYLAVVLNDKGNADAARQLLDAALASRPPFAKRAAAAALRKKLG